jgi:hypothetical protein
MAGVAEVSQPAAARKTMKLRIQGNSLRLRISPSEMARFLESGRIEEAIHFGAGEDASLTYALEHSPQTTATTVRYDSRELTVMVASREAQRWAEGQDVGLYGESSTRRGPLQIAVEKDFACLDKDSAANADTFPNPNQGQVC